MITQIKNHGGSSVIVLNKEFMKFQNLKDGDWINISEIVKVKKSKGEEKENVQ